MSASSLLVIGLGNPGAEYEDTRHNVGHQVVDALAERLGVSFDHQPNALVGWGNHDGAEIGLAVPLTYMNRSGDPVAALQEHYGLALDQLLIVVDDLHLPIGTIRLRPSGSSGGHNVSPTSPSGSAPPSFPASESASATSFPTDDSPTTSCLPSPTIRRRWCATRSRRRATPSSRSPTRTWRRR